MAKFFVGMCERREILYCIENENIQTIQSSVDRALILLKTYFMCFGVKVQQAELFPSSKNCQCTRFIKKSDISFQSLQVFTRWRLILTEDGHIAPRSLLVSLSAVQCQSKASDIILIQAETFECVSIGAVLVRFSDPVFGHHPSVQDLGVSTWHCQSDKMEE